MSEPETEATRLEPVPQTEDIAHPSLEELARLLPQYEIHEIIGVGGMGAVYKARQVALDRWVAIKVLPATLAQNAEDVQRFIKEARAMAKLVHPHIVAVFDFGQTHERHLFLVMEYVEGSDLHRRTRQGEITVERTRQIIAQLCDALQFAHDRGVAHRDIKPANILITSDWKVKVADFGLARDLSAQPNPDEVEYGTPDYTAPERLIIGATVDHRADIYALGVVIHEMLTGKTPAALDGKIGEGLPPGFAEVITKCLHGDPEGRYQKATQVKLALLTATSEGRLNSPPAHPPETGSPPAAPPDARSFVEPPIPYRAPLLLKLRNKLSPLGWAAACIVLVGMFAWLILPKDQPAESLPEKKPAEKPGKPEPKTVQAEAVTPAPGMKSGIPAAVPAPATAPPAPAAPAKSVTTTDAPRPVPEPVKKTAPKAGTVPFTVPDGDAGEVARLDGHRTAVYAVQLLPDQNRVVSTGVDGTVRAWDLTAGKLLWNTDPGIDMLMRLQVSPEDGVIFTYGYKADKMALLDMNTGGILHAAAYPNERLVGAVYVPSARLVIAGGSNDDGLKNLFVWKPSEGGELKEIGGYTGRVYGMTLVPGGEEVLITASEPFMNGDKRLYRPAISLYSPGKGTFSKIEAGKLGYVTRFFGPPGIKTVVTGGSSIKVLSVPEMETLLSLPGPPREGPFITAGQVVNLGRLLLSGWSDNTIRVHEVSSGEEVWRQTVPEPVTDMAVGHDERWAVLSTRYKDSKNQLEGDFDLLVWRLPRWAELVSEKTLLQQVATQLPELEKHDAELAGLRNQLRKKVPVPQQTELDALKEKLDVQYANALRREYPLATPTDQSFIKAELELLGRRDTVPAAESDHLLPPLMKKLRSIYHDQLEALGTRHEEDVKSASQSAKNLLEPMAAKRAASGDKLGALRVKAVLQEWTPPAEAKAADAIKP